MDGSQSHFSNEIGFQEAASWPTTIRNNAWPLVSKGAPTTICLIENAVLKILEPPLHKKRRTESYMLKLTTAASMYSYL